MSVKTVFKTFLGHVHKEMWRRAGEKDFEWVKVGFSGAQGVRTLFKEKPEVVVAEEDGGKAKFVVSHEKYTHHFLVEERRFKYTRMNGKEMYKFKAGFEKATKNIKKRANAFN